MMRSALMRRLVLALLLAACSSREEVEERPGTPSEPPRVPDPLPKHKYVNVDASAPGLDGGGEAEKRCSAPKPFVCMLEDGSFVCSDVPCVPDCSKIGCIGGEVCRKCADGYRCVAPASVG